MVESRPKSFDASVDGVLLPVPHVERIDFIPFLSRFIGLDVMHWERDGWKHATAWYDSFPTRRNASPPIQLVLVGPVVHES